MIKKKKKASSPIYVYKIEIEGTIRYWGITNDIKRRQAQHNKGLLSDLKKDLYVKLRELNVHEIHLIEVHSFKTRVEAKRMECMLILIDHFGPMELFQKVPNISDR